METAALIAIIAGFFVWMLLDRRIFVSRELGRFDEDSIDVYSRTKKTLNSIYAAVGMRSQSKLEHKKKQRLSKSQRQMSKMLEDAGLESNAERGKYLVLQGVCYLGSPLLGSMGYVYLPTYYATVMILTVTIVGLLIPTFWLKAKIARRTEDIQRELPLLIDLTNLGTSAGWDVGASLERVVDALDYEFPRHPLLREFKKGKWLTSTGFTWQETLDRIGDKLGNDAVRRCTLALGQAMKQGGDRTGQLEGIAEDAQRVYYGELDKRLAALPVKAVLITMLLLVSYFLILMAPAGIQIKNMVFH